MRRTPLAFVLPFVLGLPAAALLAPAALAGNPRGPAKKKSAEPPLPHARVVLQIDAPTLDGPWTMSLRNNDTVPVRVVADARNLVLLVRAKDSARYEECRLPDAMRSARESRRIVLDPGARYDETFDPALFCFGKLHALLAAESAVTAFLGWTPSTKPWLANKPPQPPFELEPAIAPATVAFDKRVVSLTVWLPAAITSAAASSPAPDAPHALGAAQLALATNRFEDAASFRTASITATVKNSGDRSGVIHLRGDSLELRVSGPGLAHDVLCAAGSDRRAVARDLFQTIAPGKSSSLTVLVNEVCPRGTFAHPGLYRVAVTLRARESGAEFGIDAIHGDFSAPDPVLLRVQQAAEPYHATPPHVVLPTPASSS